MELIEEMSNATDNEKHAIGVFVDLKKAFNTVHQCSFYGMRGVGNDWMKSYLTNRKQFVELNGCASELLNVTQGSI